MNNILYHSVRLHCNVTRAFDMFTVNKRLQSWLTVIADVEPKVGGKFELFWNPEDKENDSTIGCKITAIKPDSFVAFEWRGPKQYKHFMNEIYPLTHVVVFFIPCSEEAGTTYCTDVHLIHSGWRNSAEWQEARLWTGKNWDNTFEKLKKYVDES